MREVIIVFGIVAIMLICSWMGLIVGERNGILDARRETLRWLEATIEAARAQRGVLDVVELPGYQGVLRRFRADFFK